MEELTITIKIITGVIAVAVFVYLAYGIWYSIYGNYEHLNKNKVMKEQTKRFKFYTKMSTKLNRLITVDNDGKIEFKNEDLKRGFEAGQVMSDELIEAQREYLEYLEKECSEYAQCLLGYNASKLSKEVIQKGIDLRKRINELNTKG